MVTFLTFLTDRCNLYSKILYLSKYDSQNDVEHIFLDITALWLTADSDLLTLMTRRLYKAEEQLSKTTKELQSAIAEVREKEEEILELKIKVSLLKCCSPCKSCWCFQGYSEKK